MQHWSIIEIDSRVFERNLGKIRFTRTFPSLLFGSCTDLEGLIPPLLFQIKMFSLCLMRGLYCRGIRVEIEMYFDSIMDSINTHQSDHCRMERRGGEGGGGGRWCSLARVQQQRAEDTMHPGAVTPAPSSPRHGTQTRGYTVIWKWKYSSLILVLPLHRLAIQYSAINTTSLSLPSTTAKS